MTEPDRIIADLKRALDAQDGVICELREQMQEAQATASEVEAWEQECQRLTKLHEQSVHVPWAKFDEIVRDLENGNTKHALELLRREAHS